MNWKTCLCAALVLSTLHTYAQSLPPDVLIQAISSGYDVETTQSVENGVTSIVTKIRRPAPEAQAAPTVSLPAEPPEAEPEPALAGVTPPPPDLYFHPNPEGAFRTSSDGERLYLWFPREAVGKIAYLLLGDQRVVFDTHLAVLPLETRGRLAVIPRVNYGGRPIYLLLGRDVPEPGASRLIQADEVLSWGQDR